MFWKRWLPRGTTMESEIRRALDAGVSAKDASYFNTNYPFRMASDYESIESRLEGLTNLAVKIRMNCREYSSLYPRGEVGTFKYLLDTFLSDEEFKKNILQATQAREVEVQRSLAMVEAVREGKDKLPGFLQLVEAETLDDIKRAKNMLNRRYIGREIS